MARESSSPIPSTLNDKTLELLLIRPRTITYKVMAKHASCSVSWIDNYSKGRVRYAPVCRVQALYELLARKKLEV